jgi:serine phosphatase RsbU (regulator of sigma subunit)
MVRASPIADPESGRVLYAANVFEDVTGVKRAQLAEAFMAQASRVLASSMDYAETLQLIARLAAAQLADWCAVDILGESGELERVAVHHAEPQKLALAQLLDSSYRPTLDEAIGVPEVIRSGKARIYNDITGDALATYARDAEHLRMLREMDTRDVIIVPLAAPSRTLGAITLVSSSTSRRLGADDVDVAVRLGRRAGTAVESARLYTERTRIARVLQQALLPDSLPGIQGFEIAAAYRPAGELNEVGGDFYDVFKCGEQRWMLVIGDVCGKGPAAASITALARHTLRAAAMFDQRPSAMLHALHRALRQSDTETQMCTVCLVVVDPPGAVVPLTVALAGHPQPLLFGRDGKASPVGEPGTVLGVVDPIMLSEVQIDLHQGETLLLYTDGVSEAAPSDLIATLELADLCMDAPEMSVEHVLKRFESAAVESAGGRPRDDIALLGLRLANLTLG